ncbi:MAG: 4-hydroxy-tetrahydrodipicolinate synthase [uncultured Acidimicrobiales bacterium]|uniref:4-hydroxy-tetrahydrodipicolinate synthase n=1 Tax=uncultured Acidimicrobiales bacterium TaxID=310071 RepID=A0A6J4IM43_9ACTN|nr:MAG: 4-hydroxy-tetrahydrodipicolinate synthase [uncultured Acidimicrobiales bacterium]
MAGGRFGAVLTAMVTPFDDNGALDLDGAVRLARWLVEHGNDGLVVCGTTGEAPTLSDDEKVQLWRAVAEAVTVPVVAGSTSNDTAHSIELTKAAEACGVAAILAQTPYYNRPSQAGIEAHFRAVAGATSLPVLLYDIPVRTGRKINHETLLALANDVENVVGVKDAAGDPAASAQLLAEAPGGFELYSGDDPLTLPLLAIGAVGVVGVASHWGAPQFQDMVESFAKGDVRAALDSHRRLLPSFAFETSDANPYPVPAKAMLRLLGLPAGRCRLPHVEVDSDQLVADARAIVVELGVSVA